MKLSPTQAAKRFGLSADFWRAQIKAGNITHYENPAGGEPLLDTADLEAFWQKYRKPAKSRPTISEYIDMLHAGQV